MTTLLTCPQPARHPRQRRSRPRVRLAALPRPVRQIDPQGVDRDLGAGRAQLALHLSP